jgi:cytochrome c-type biogenesis protein
MQRLRCDLAAGSIWGGIVLAFLLALLAGVLTWTPTSADEAPDLSAPLLDGTGDLSLHDLRGEVVLVNIWATWCEPCKREMPELQALSEEYGAEGLHVLGVSLDIGGSNERIAGFASDLGVNFTLVRDEAGDFQREFRTSGVPETILIDRSGNIAYQWKGELEADSAENRTLIEAALASTGAVESDAIPRVATVGLLAAFAAGLLSVLSPCVFPLIPTYAAYITGVSAEEMSRQQADQRQKTRRIALGNGLLFVGGFSVVFIAMGASASAIGGLLHDYRDWIARVGGVLLLVMGLHMLGVFRIAALDRIVRPSFGQSGAPARPIGTFAVGMAFGAGWTPCIGPALASILTLAAATASMGQGVLLLTIYSLGLALPFLLGTVLIDRFMRHRKGFGPWLPRLERISAVLIIAIGILMLSGALTRLSAWTSTAGTLM